MKRSWERSVTCLILYIFILSIHGCTTTSDATRGDANGELYVIGNEICQEVRTGKMWQISKAGLFSSSDDVEQYAANLNLGGYNDWRLPTRDEMFDLYYIFFWEKNGNCTMNRDGNFWALSEQEAPLPGHWETYFLCNPEHRYVHSQGTRGYVRAVRP